MTVNKQIGFITTLSLVLGIVIGGGILVLPSAIAHYGKWGFWAWPIASFAVLNLAFMFGSLSKKVPGASGPSSFVQKYFGNVMGFQVAWAHTIGMSMAIAVIAISMTGYLASAVGIDETKWGMLISLGTVWTLVGLNALHTVLSLGSMVIITFIKIITLLLIVFFGISSINPAIATAPVGPGIPDGFGGMFGALALVLFTFIGIESATLPGENVKKPEVTIPLATIAGTIISALLFVLTYVIVWSIVPNDELVKSSAPVALAANILMGSIGVKLISALAVISCFGSVNGCIFAASHILRSSANAGWLPKVFAKQTHAAFPVAGGVLASLIGTIVIVIYYNINPAIAYLVRNNAAQLEVFLVSIVYLISCMAYKLSGGNKWMWMIGVVSCIGFLFGAMDDYLSAALGTLTFFSGVVIYTGFAHRMRAKHDESVK